MPLEPIVEQMVPRTNICEGQIDPSPLLFLQIFLPMVSQLVSPMSQHMAIGKPPGLTPPMPSTKMDSLIPSQMIDSLMPLPMITSPMPSLIMAPATYSHVYPTMTQQTKTTQDIPSTVYQHQ